MIINNTNNFIFIHVPKTGGTSISALLSGINKVNDIEIGGTQFGELIQTHCVKKYGISKHSTAAVLRKSLGENIWNRYTKISVVRDPLRRVYSAYNFLRRWEGTPARVTDLLTRYDFNEFVLSGMLESETFPDNLFRPQAYWLTDASGKLMVDILGRTERLSDFVLNINNYLGLTLNPNELPHHLMGSNEGATSFDGIAIDVRNKIKNLYQIDYELFK